LVYDFKVSYKKGVLFQVISLISGFALNSGF